MTCFSRFSNSPFTPAPAWSRPRSSVRTTTFLRTGGTSPCATRTANPSTTAVLPTPASPVRIGLFWRRRIRMSTIWRTSDSRPTTGSISPLRARSVRLIVYWSSEGVELGAALGSPGAAPSARAASPERVAIWASSPEPRTRAGRPDQRGSTWTLANSFEESRRACRACRSASSGPAASGPGAECPPTGTARRPRAQASRHELCQIEVESEGVRAWPVSEPVDRAGQPRPGAVPGPLSKCRKISTRSVFGASESLSSQCSISTLAFVRERQRPAPAWRRVESTSC